MRIVTVRRISQVFFLVVFLWFCVTATLGAAWWQLRGWPINWILDLDPLTALATVLATGTLYATLAWSLVAIVAAPWWWAGSSAALPAPWARSTRPPAGWRGGGLTWPAGWRPIATAGCNP